MLHLLGEPDQADEHLGRGLRIGKSPVAGTSRDAEEVGERGEADAAHASLEQAPGERGGAERRLGKPPAVQPLQLPLQEPLVEAGVVGGERGVAGEGDEAFDDARHGWCSAQLVLAQSGQTRYRLRESNARVDERLERIDQLERPYARCSDLADPVPSAREPGRLQVEDDELGLLQQRIFVSAGQETVVPVQTMRLSPAVTSVSSEQARPSETGPVANSSLAASAVDRAPSSWSASTRRSSPSSASCIVL